MEYSHLTDAELHDLLAKSDGAQDFLNSKVGKIIQEVAHRKIEHAVAKFALQAKADDLREMIELQTIIRVYKYELFDDVKFLAREGENIFDEIHGRRNPLNATTGILPEEGD